MLDGSGMRVLSRKCIWFVNSKELVERRQRRVSCVLIRDGVCLGLAKICRKREF